jgi:hypothetical protein
LFHGKNCAVRAKVIWHLALAYIFQDRSVERQGVAAAFLKHHFFLCLTSSVFFI